MDPVTAFNCSLERNETAQPADLVLDCHDSLLLRFLPHFKKADSLKVYNKKECIDLLQRNPGLHHYLH
jgi:hypothetical protein